MPIAFLIAVTMAFGGCLGIVFGFSTGEIAMTAPLGAALGAGVGATLGLFFRRH